MNEPKQAFSLYLFINRVCAEPKLKLPAIIIGVLLFGFLISQGWGSP
jgi:hypothetical protein